MLIFPSSRRLFSSSSVDQATFQDINWKAEDSEARHILTLGTAIGEAFRFSNHYLQLTDFQRHRKQLSFCIVWNIFHM